MENPVLAIAFTPWRPLRHCESSKPRRPQRDEENSKPLQHTSQNGTWRRITMASRRDVVKTLAAAPALLTN
jgi:hypothetical protein